MVQEDVVGWSLARTRKLMIAHRFGNHKFPGAQVSWRTSATTVQFSWRCADLQHLSLSWRTWLLVWKYIVFQIFLTLLWKTSTFRTTDQELSELSEICFRDTLIWESGISSSFGLRQFEYFVLQSWDMSNILIHVWSCTGIGHFRAQRRMLWLSQPKWKQWKWFVSIGFLLTLLSNTQISFS